MTSLTDNDPSLTKTLHTLTININGLNNDNNEFFQILKNKNFDIVIIQETDTKSDIIGKIEK